MTKLFIMRYYEYFCYFIVKIGFDTAENEPFKMC